MGATRLSNYVEQKRELLIYNKENVALLIERYILFCPDIVKYSFYVLSNLNIEFRKQWAIWSMQYVADKHLSSEKVPSEFSSMVLKALDFITNCRYMINDGIGLSVAHKILGN